MFEMIVEAVFNVDGKVVAGGRRVNTYPISIWRRVKIINPNNENFYASISRIEYIWNRPDAICLYLEKDYSSKNTIRYKDDIIPNAKLQEIGWM